MTQQSASVPKSFRAYLYTSFGATEKELKLRDNFPQKPLGAAQVLVKVASAALNPVDWKWLETGPHFFPKYPSEETPFRIGFDASGTIAALGSDVKALAVGDAVYLMTPFAATGTVAEYIAVDAEFVAPKPKNIDFDQAAGVPLAALTSYQSLLHTKQIQKGSRVLILGGSSGTGSFAVQIAKALGAHVTTTTSFRNTEFVKSLGADLVIDYTKEKWVDLLEPHSIDVIYDCGVEPASWNDDAQKVLKKDTGHFVTIWFIPNPIKSAIGAKQTHYIVKPSGEDLRELTKLVEAGKIVPTIDSVHSFENALDAIAKLKSNRARGKVVVKVAEA